MYEVENPELPPGHVAQVIQAGYMLGDRVLRPALVAVVKAAPKAAAYFGQRQSASARHAVKFSAARPRRARRGSG